MAVRLRHWHKPCFECHILLSRRSFLGTCALVSTTADGTTTAPFRLAQQCISAIAAQLDAIGSGPALLASYPSLGNAPKQFATANALTAYVYDNALAGLSLLALGEPLRAAQIADALALAQEHDPDFADGRLRNAYRAGAIHGAITLPGWWDSHVKRWVEDPYQVGSESGPIAWAILLWTALALHGINSNVYFRAAKRAAHWINRNLVASKGFYGGYFGFPPNPQKLRWISTEQNTDLAIAFHRVGMTAEAAHSAQFVHTMHNPHTGLFAAGLTPNGRLNTMIAADANLWPYLAGLTNRAVVGITIRELAWPRVKPAGIGFSLASQGIWLEGTGFAALSLIKAGYVPQGQNFLATIRTQMAPDGYIFAASTPTLYTGLAVGPGKSSEKFEYYRVPALAPTAWAALAADGYNPLVPNIS